MHGDLEGSLLLEQPVINIVRDASGRVNVDALLPHSIGADDIFAIASKRAVHHVQIAGGTIRVIDRAGGAPREIRMASVDAELHGLGEGTPVHLDAEAGFESTTHNVSFRGDVGPWGRGETPTYKLDRVALDSVPLRAFPQVGAVMGGGLTFEGRLATAGETWNEITSRVSGGGEMSVVAGSIAGHNFVVRRDRTGARRPGRAQPAGCPVHGEQHLVRPDRQPGDALPSRASTRPICGSPATATSSRDAARST